MIMMCLVFAVAFTMLIYGLSEYGDHKHVQTNQKTQVDIFDIFFTKDVVAAIKSLEHHNNYVVNLGGLYIKHTKCNSMVEFYVVKDGLSLYEIGRIPHVYISESVVGKPVSIKYEKIIDIQKCIDSNKPKLVSEKSCYELEHSSYGYSMTGYLNGKYHIGLNGNVYREVPTFGYINEYELYNPKYLTEESLSIIERINYE